MAPKQSSRAAPAAGPASGPARAWPPLLALASLAMFVVAGLRLAPFLVDDVFISLRYGRHLLAGEGLVYNLHERVEGYTNFLWTLLASPACVVPIGVYPYVHLLNGIFAVLAAWQAGEVLSRLAAPGPAGPAAGPRAAAWIALGASIFLLQPVIWVSAAEGLETMLFTFLLLLAVHRLIADPDEAPVPPASLALAALVMTRPDGVLVLLAAPVVAWAAGRSRGAIVRTTAIALALAALYGVARGAWYGDVWPNTFYAKHGGGAVLLERGGRESVELAARLGGPLLLAGVAVLLGARRRLAAAIVLLVALRVAFQLWSGGAQMGRFRFLVPVVPLVQLLAVAGACVWIRSPARRVAFAALAAAGLLVPAWLAYPRAEADALGYAMGLQTAHTRFGQDVLEHTSETAVIAISDAGLAPLICDRTNIDVLGLNDRHMAHLPGAYGERVDVPYVLGRRPDLVVLLGRTARPREARDFWLTPEGAMFADPAFRARYGYCRRYEFNPGYFLLVFRRHDSVAAPAAYWGGAGDPTPAD